MLLPLKSTGCKPVGFFLRIVLQVEFLFGRHQRAFGSGRRIAVELDVNREPVSRYVEMAVQANHRRSGRWSTDLIANARAAAGHSPTHRRSLTQHHPVGCHSLPKMNNLCRWCAAEALHPNPCHIATLLEPMG